MTIQIIFEGDVKDTCKDILFFTAYTGMDIQVGNLSLDSLLMPSCAYLFAVCY
jgi:hypothetical protein